MFLCVGREGWTPRHQTSIKIKIFVLDFFFNLALELRSLNMSRTGVEDLDITACLGLMFSIFPIISSPQQSNVTLIFIIQKHFNLAWCQELGSFANPSDL